MVDALLFFRDLSPKRDASKDYELLRLCDVYNIPVATNLATAEILVQAIDRGDLDWRNLVNPRSDINRGH